jgi:hypothetical protein
MEIISDALKAIPEAASHPFALIAYLCVVASWAVIAFRVQRNSELLKHIEKLPGKRSTDRAAIRNGRNDSQRWDITN